MSIAWEGDRLPEHGLWIQTASVRGEGASAWVEGLTEADRATDIETCFYGLGAKARAKRAARLVVEARR